eukprot:CAMPEP_0183590016 /NCGR_PEP_ID=MMETSP0371-20130417/163802_1 /TAXON_ID=268820 /ORGANISM="Peridinium aciculiferum, Strain PAER-2" /LENGTH=45 /DNA_ID= /DNA_START= /DNA_END= /DNA_ORIENTATION=
MGLRKKSARSASVRSMFRGTGAVQAEAQEDIVFPVDLLTSCGPSK